MSEEAITSVQLVRPNIDVEQERKRPRLEVLLFCHYAALDKQGKGTFAGTFDRLFVDPAVKQSGTFYLVVRTGETRTGKITVSIISPKDELLGNLFYEPQVDRPPDEPSHIQFIEGMGFQADEEGIYWFDVSFNGESLGGTSLTVKFRSPREHKAEGEE